ncbi:MAG: DUF998 domain-containing protein [Pseudolysinimonas sp.]
MTPSPRIPAIVWLVSGAMWFVLEGIAAAAFPGYSYAENYISDLGVTVPDVVDGRVIDSRLSAVMNVEFVAHGILFIVAAIMIVRLTGGMLRWLFLLLAVAHGAGLLLVAVFHSSSAANDDGTILLHVAGANLAIIGGNLALIVAGIGAGRLGASRRYRVFSILWGVIGLVTIAMLFVDTHDAALNLLPDGVWERAAVYPMMTWEIVTGVLVLAGRRRSVTA